MSIKFCDLCKAKCEPNEQVPHWDHELVLSYAIPDSNREGWELGVVDCCHVCAKQIYAHLDGLLMKLKEGP